MLEPLLYIEVDCCLLVARELLWPWPPMGMPLESAILTQYLGIRYLYLLCRSPRVDRPLYIFLLWLLIHARLPFSGEWSIPVN